jgi:hypothetical protein
LAIDPVLASASTPSLILAIWAAGIAGGGAIVAWWRIVGPGYGWLTASVAVFFGGFAVLAGAGPGAVVGTVFALAAVPAARSGKVSAVLLGAAAAAFLYAGLDEGVRAVTGALALGGVTTMMLLGHWYLVDPRLPRRPLFRLGTAGLTGTVLDAGLLAASGALGWEGADWVLGWSFIALAIATAVLLVAALLATRQPRYSGVMAATGLSYLAILTSVGAVVLGRILLNGSG